MSFEQKFPCGCSQKVRYPAETMASGNVLEYKWSEPTMIANMTAMQRGNLVLRILKIAECKEPIINPVLSSGFFDAGEREGK